MCWNSGGVKGHFNEGFLEGALGYGLVLWLSVYCSSNPLMIIVLARWTCSERLSC